MPNYSSSRALVAILAIAGLVMAGLAWYAAANPRIIIEWSTASELDTAGFNLYRSDESNPEPIRLNDALIPPSSDPQQGGSYAFTDKQVEPDRMYTYTLEEVELSGTLIDHGATQADAPQGGLLEGGSAVILFAAAAFIAFRQRKKAS